MLRLPLEFSMNRTIGAILKENFAMKSMLRIGLSCLFFIQLGLIGFAQSGTIITLAGTSSPGYSGDGGAAIAAQINKPYGVAVDSAGNLFIADGLNHVVRKVSTSGVITTVAGNGYSGYSGDGGLAISAQLSTPFGIAIDSTGNLFIADSYNHSIRAVSASSGIITTVAGNGSFGFSGDGGQATSAQLNYPFGVAVDSAGNIFIADADNHRIRKVSSLGVITTVAGNGSYGFSGDSGAATSAKLNWPNGIAVDSTGSFYIADTSNNRIRKVSAVGIINTIAGDGTTVYDGDGISATSASISVPTGIAVDAAGSLFIADQYHSRIRKISSGIIATVAGNGSSGFSGDGGAATLAQINFPYSVAVDSTGNLFIADSNNYRIREVTVAAPPSTLTYFPQVAIGGGWSTSFTLNNTGSGTIIGNLILTDYQGNPFTVNSSGLGLGSSFPISIPAGGAMFLNTSQVSPNDLQKVGWARVETTAGGSLSGVATYQSVLNEVIQAATGVLSSQPTQYATIPVDENDSQNRKVAYAIANQTSQVLTIKAALVDVNGIVVNDTVSITLNPGQQIARYFNQDFAGRPTFQGSIVLRAQGGGSFIIVGLIQNQQFFTAIPVIPSKAATIPN
jgi:sugar lactone lactonase YvrE